MLNNVFIFSSFHHGPNPIQNLMEDVDAILAVRLGLYKQIVTVDRVGIGFFCDSQTKTRAKDLEGVIRMALKALKRLKETPEKAEIQLEELFANHELRENEPQSYEIMETAKLFTYLRILGFDVSFKPTESRNYRCMSTRTRDSSIYRNIEEHGTGTNILFVGEYHKLEDLRESPDFKCYRIEVVSRQAEILKRTLKLADLKGYDLRQVISRSIEMLKKGTSTIPIEVYGTIPQKYRSGFEQFKTEFEQAKGRVLEMQLTYV